MAQSLHNLGNLALERGDYGQARALHEEALAIRRARGARVTSPSPCATWGGSGALRGEYGTAHLLLEELAPGRPVGGTSRAGPCTARASWRCSKGTPPRAAGAFAESLALARAVGLMRVGRRPEGIAPAAAPGGAELAVRLLGAAEAVRENSSGPQLPTERVQCRPWPGYGRPGEPALLPPAAGRRMGVDEAIETGPPCV